MLDIIIRNGRIIDPSQNIDKNGNIYIKGGVIVELDSRETENIVAEREIDASGCIITPGLIDSHLHAYYSGGSYKLNVPPDIACIPNGVTTCIDAGSSGPFTFESFYSGDIIHSVTTVKAMLHMSFNGIMPAGWDEIEDPRSFDIEMLKRIFYKHRDTIVGLKIRQHNQSVRGLGSAPLKATVELANELNNEGLRCIVTVHVSDLPNNVTMEDIVEILRPGDVFTHTYQNRGKTIFDKDMKVLECIAEAKERGIYFDSGCATGMFAVKNVVKALKQGFYPDIIGTDLVGFNLYKRPLMSLPYVMSMFFNMGMRLDDVIKAVTATPANVYGIKDIAGSLSKGENADISILKMVSHPSTYKDFYGESFTGDTLFLPMATIKEGRVVYQRLDM
ncbi:amidohydrolase family protein [Intestinimonas butyriciproducens]|uniref:amidohydrolase family protein n=1 Tax=Intestinimonas butyriciproducens TaxID=1297617 RepID=UPI001C10DB8F|nr:amidohydrolase family protein [Intestinimonas butyriciproducens]MBU5230473.1 amidohydrolase family protein [Intestinimonas butyriciproducens]